MIPHPQKVSPPINRAPLGCDKSDFRMLKKSIHHDRQLIRQQNVIIHTPLKKFSPREMFKWHKILCLCLCCPVPDIAHTYIIPVVLHQRLSTIIRSIIANDDLNIGIDLCPCTFKCLLKKCGTIIRWDHNTDKRCR